MNEKNNKFLFVMCLILFTVILAGSVYVIYLKNERDNNRAADFEARERELLERIGEHQRAEEQRAAREAERIERETARINAERERIERTETAIRAIRGIDRQSGSLLQELAEEVGILQDFYYNTRSEHFSAGGGTGE